MTQVTRKLTLTLLTWLALGAPAQALVLNLNDSMGLSITDNGPGDSDSALGSILYNGPTFDGYNVIAAAANLESVGFAQSGLGIAILFLSGPTGSITVNATDSFNDPAVNLSVFTGVGGPADLGLPTNTLQDLQNVSAIARLNDLNGNRVIGGPLEHKGNGAPFDLLDSMNVETADSYQLSLDLNFEFEAAIVGLISVGGSIVTVPEPDSLALLSLPLLVLALRRRRALPANQSQR